MSLVEWCERKTDLYETTNSISNIAYVIAHLQSPNSHVRWIISAVGLGSFYFHISGSYIGEIADELAMSMLAYSYFMDIYAPSTAYEIAFTAIWTLYIIFGAYGIFISFFIFQIVTPVYILTFHIQKTQKQKKDLLKSAVWLSTAICCWGYERYLYANGLCPVDATDPLYYLHSYWHICSALAHYYLSLVIHGGRILYQSNNSD